MSHSSSYEKDQQIEKSIVKSAVKELLKSGFSVSVFDTEEEYPVSNDYKAIVAQLFATDGEYLYAYKNGDFFGKVFLVYGNEPWYVICDYSMSLEPFLKETNSKAAAYEEKHG